MQYAVVEYYNVKFYIIFKREFKEMLKYAKAYDKRAMMDIIEMYRPLLISKSVVNGKFDEDLYQEFVYTMLMCILKFPYPQSKPEE